LFPKTCGLIIDSGISEPEEIFSKRVPKVNEEVIFKESRKLFKHQKKLNNFSGFSLLLHCNDDDIIPATMANKLFEWLATPFEKKKICLFEKGGHNYIFPMNADQIEQELSQFFSLCGGSSENSNSLLCILAFVVVTFIAVAMRNKEFT